MRDWRSHLPASGRQRPHNTGRLPQCNEDVQNVSILIIVSLQPGNAAIHTPLAAVSLDVAPQAWDADHVLEPRLTSTFFRVPEGTYDDTLLLLTGDNSVGIHSPLTQQLSQPSKKAMRMQPFQIFRNALMAELNGPTNILAEKSI